MKKIVNILKKAKKLLSHKGAWTRGTFARNERGHDVDYNSAEAVSFCLLGALHKITLHKHKIADADREYDNYKLAKEYIIKSNYLPYNDIAVFNDTSTFEEVLQALDKAIALAEKDNG